MKSSETQLLSQSTILFEVRRILCAVRRKVRFDVLRELARQRGQRLVLHALHHAAQPPFVLFEHVHLELEQLLVLVRRVDLRELLQLALLCVSEQNVVQCL